MNISNSTRNQTSLPAVFLSCPRRSRWQSTRRRVAHGASCHRPWRSLLHIYPDFLVLGCFPCCSVLLTFFAITRGGHHAQAHLPFIRFQQDVTLWELDIQGWPWTAGNWKRCLPLRAMVASQIPWSLIRDIEKEMFAAQPNAASVLKHEVLWPNNMIFQKAKKRKGVFGVIWAMEDLLKAGCDSMLPASSRQTSLLADP